MRAGPLADREVFCAGPLFPAGGAQLAGRVEAVNHDDLFAIPGSLVLQLATELAPRCIADRLGQLMVLDHVFRGQVLDADDVVLADQLGGQLVLHVQPLVSDALMDTRNLDALLQVALAALCFSGQPALLFGELLFKFAEMLGVFELLAIGGDSV